MVILTQLYWLLILSLVVASISWTVTQEEIFKEPRDAAKQRSEKSANILPTLPPDHPDADAVCLIQSFYSLAVNLAERRGTNVNHPRHLQKVTRTR